MAGLRLLGLALFVLCTSGASCSQDVPTPVVSGQVVDARTGEPVVGAEVFISFHASNRLGWLDGTAGGSIGFRWTTTDENGEFAFEDVVMEGVAGHLEVEDVPWLFLVHRDYGTHTLYARGGPEQYLDARFEIEPHENSLRLMTKPSELSSVCGGLRGRAYSHCCDYVYGPEERECKETHRYDPS